MNNWYRSFKVESSARKGYNWWLERYTQDQNNVSTPSEEVWEKLTSNYPFAGGTLCRGINLTNEKDWNYFQKQIEKGIIKFDHITSWFKLNENGLKGAKQFALTSPSYNVDQFAFLSNFKNVDDKELLNGYRGLIIKTNTDAFGIDVDKSKYAKEHSEVILPAGEYKISVVKIYKTYSEMIKNNEIDINEIILNASSDELKNANIRNQDWDSGLLDYIISKQGYKLNDIAKEKLWNEFKPLSPYWQTQESNASGLEFNIGENSLLHKKYIRPYVNQSVVTFIKLCDSKTFDKFDGLNNLMHDILTEYIDIFKNLYYAIDNWKFVKRFSKKYGFNDILTELNSIIDQKIKLLKELYDNNSIIMEYNKLNSNYKDYIRNFKKANGRSPSMNDWTDDIIELNNQHKSIYKDYQKTKWYYEKDLELLNKMKNY